MTINGDGSSGLTYRADFYWLIRVTLASDSTIDEQTIETEEPNLYIDSNDIEAGDISIRVSVTTALGTSTFIVFNVEKTSIEETDVNIYGIDISNNGVGNWIGGSDLRLYVDIDSNNCDGVSYVNYDIEWIIDDLVAQSSAITQGNEILIPAGTLTVKQEKENKEKKEKKEKKQQKKLQPVSSFFF